MRFSLVSTPLVVLIVTSSSSAWMIPKNILRPNSLPTTTTRRRTKAITITQTPPQPTTTSSSSSSLAMSSSSSGPMTTGDMHAATVEEMKADIARMRQEALQRLELLNEQMSQAELAWKEQKELEDKIHEKSSTKSSSSTTMAAQVVDTNGATSSIPTSNSFPVIPAPHKSEDIFSFQEAEEIDTLLKARLERDKMHFMDPVVVAEAEATTDRTASLERTSSKASAPLKFLDDTRWRLMLNIGREPGTWMPKTWGASGDRVRLHLEIEFSNQQLYEREEFLNGVSGAKVLKVIHGHGDLAPTMDQGGRQVRIGEVGGWRVAPNEGPMGTSVLRFYFDLEEETRHAKSDVYCPAGRIYCTCGYFPMQDRDKQQGQISEKDMLKKEMRQIEAQYETLAAENEMDTNLVSWDKFQRSKKMLDLRMRATKLNTKMHEAQVREPEKSLLRLSQDQSVGLTREGGVCCKVHKGLAIEYHILGRLEIASMANREHSDYRELLP